MAAAATSPALKRLDLRDPAALFETHGTEEIRGLERQVRAEIEHKKEELRQMVGERYRDLIEAADTIGQMRCCAEGLVDAVKATDQYCARLRQAGSAAALASRDPQVLAHGFTQSLLSDDAGSVLATATSWDELEIQEEAESGSSVTSKIRLPVQPSWYVQSFLFSLCQEINRVGGHALPKVTLQEMLKSCLVQVVAAYEKLLEEKDMKKEGAFPMTQNRALQLLYDLRYLNIVLTAKGEEVKSSRSKQDSRIEKVADSLEAFIDPFDLDVFTPHLNSNLNRLVQRTSVLFGLVTGTENQFTPRSSTFNSQEPHNILPLASSQIRFGLLPLSMTSTRKAKSTGRSIESEAQAVPPALSRADDPTHPGSLFRQLVSEEDDSSTPSLFTLGWLSSMTKSHGDIAISL
uniref:Conserved oligomeric Golgi complex subunit 1 n=1 Tax=Rousettus aegyptiacus TaxID=9407 RepID=A0A7J8G5Y5_ROUAE|nr:component of oligomeric golgi complex 1 [Rousettus aegyptiacus]